MSRLKKLISEIHHRSLWQVLLIYVGAGWVVFQIVQTVTEGLGLPPWFPAFAALLLLIGLPIVLATAFVREGEPATTVSDPTLMPVDEARTEAARRRRFVTWRNAVASFVVALAVWGIVATGWLVLGGGTGDASAVADERPSIAVLPLANRSGLQEDDYFTHGIHDEIINQLYKIGGLSVRGRTSVMEYRDSPKNLTRIGEELKARYLLEGGVQRVRDTVHITVQLIDAQADEQIWAETYNRELSIDNLLSVQSEIARRVAASLNATVTLEELRRIEAAPTDNIEAYELYLRGMEYRRRGRTDLAVELFERAIQEDPHFMLPYPPLTSTYSFWYDNAQMPGQDNRALARSVVDRALAMNPDHPATRAARAIYLYRVERDFEQALREFEVAVHAGIVRRGWVAYVERRVGNRQRAAAILREECETHDPRNASICEEAASTYIFLRDYPEAERLNNRAIALNPEGFDQRINEVDIAILRDGDVEEAKRLLRAMPENPANFAMEWILRTWLVLDRLDGSYQEALERLDSSPLTRIENRSFYRPVPLLYAQVYALLDSTETAGAFFDSARVILEADVATRPNIPRVHSALGLAYAGLGRREDAIRHGQQAVDLLPVARDALDGPASVAALAEIYVVVGEVDAAIDQLENLLAIHSRFSVQLLRIDQIWDPLRDHPRFQALLERYE